MGYIHIDNLYKNQTILDFKECYAMEKIHGTPTRITWSGNEKNITFHSGSENHENFLSLFDIAFLKEKLYEMFPTSNVIIYGEAYGGKQQGMSSTYGDILKFIGFDVKLNGVWVNVPKAEKICKSLDIEFVDYVRCSTDLDALDFERDKFSTQAKRNGIKEDKIREGVVLKPLQEFTLSNGKRVIAKHRRDEFRETKSPRVVSKAELKLLDDAKEIVEEWVTEMRLTHVLDKLPKGINIKGTRLVISAMIEDIYREAEGEITEGKEVERLIGIKTAEMFKQRIN